VSRLFFALWPDESVRETLAAWSRAAHTAAGGRMTQPRNLHMTLAFLGETDAQRLPRVEAAARRVQLEPCLMRLDHCSWWKHNGIVWAGGDAPQPLRDAVAGLRAALKASGVRFDARAFAPHVTLLRNVRTAPILPQPEPLAWPIDRFVLVESARDGQGPVYRIAAGPFGGMGGKA